MRKEDLSVGTLHCSMQLFVFTDLLPA